MEKSRSVSTILVFFGLDPAPPSFRHARPCVRRPSGLDSSVLGPVSNSVVPDLFWKSARQEKRRNVPPQQHFGEMKNEVFFKERGLLSLKGPVR